ncbi:MAG: flagellar motor switch protein FliN [Phycisphaerales bacterium]|nr:flagellar motor switch protein FliN [Phycisphaerales bacterium]
MAENTPDPGSQQPDNRPPDEQNAGQTPEPTEPQGEAEREAPQEGAAAAPGDKPSEPVSAEQASIDEMLRAAREAVQQVNDTASSAQPQAPQARPQRSEQPRGQEFSQSAVDDALRAAREAIAAVNSGAAATPPVAQPSIDEARAEAEKLPPEPQTVPPNAHPFELQPLVDTGKNARPEGIDLLGDVNLDVKIELGRTRMFVEDVLRLKDGAVVELEKLAGDPVDVFVNERLIARGEVLVLNDNFCVRINEIVDQKAIEQARKHAS